MRVPVWVGNERREGDELISTDPGAPDRVVAEAASATPGEVEAALALASGSRAWAATPAEQRAEVLLRAADWLRQRRLEVAALEVRESAKPWPEADADVCEAIDFLEYYARGAVDLAQGAPLLQVPGERNELRYTPRGVVAVISPWNFPVAIPLGMTAAGLATGNAVILKPAEQTPGCAAIAGPGAARVRRARPRRSRCCPGEGDVGAALVRDPRVHTIAFTGSNKVGLEIVRTAAEVARGPAPPQARGRRDGRQERGDRRLRRRPRRGRARRWWRSAFVFAGQKCSAAARVLAHESIHDALVDRLAGAVEVLQVGQASELDTDVPPVIEQEAQERVARYAAEAERTGRIAAQAREVPDGGWFATPTLAADLPADSPVINEEIFGPLLAVERVKNVEAACDALDRSPFALTAGLFARNPDTVEYVEARAPVGNLYVNRSITGAMVARQPFGGNRLSGTGTKAGGPGYLLQFVEPRVVTENTMRHGLVV